MGPVPVSAKLSGRNPARACEPARRLFSNLLGAAAFAAVVFALAACAVGPNYQPPLTPVPKSFAATASLGTLRPAGPSDHRLVDSAVWWRALRDRELDSLVDRAIVASPTLEMALERIQQARAQEAYLVGTALPAVGASGGGGLGTGSDLARGRASEALVSAENTGSAAQITAIGGFDAVWELDIFGKYRRQIESAQYDVEAAMAARDYVLISLVADLTRAYLDMRALQMQLAVLRQNIAVAKHYVDFVQERYSRGITNELDVTLAQRESAQLQSQVAPLMAQIEVAKYVIAVLVGVYPESLTRELAKPGKLPVLPTRIQSGQPIDLLRRRPDILEAERQLASATALIGVAVGDLFPQVALVGSVGWQAWHGGSGPAINPIWSFGPGAAAPLLDFGRLDALVEKADYRTRELLFKYKQTVLNAVGDVDTAVSSYAAQQEQLRNLADAITAAKRAVTLAEQRFDRGLIDSLNVIDAQRQLYVLEEQYVQAQEVEANQFVQLYKSLGGGWQQYQFIPPIPTPLPAAAAAIKHIAAPDSGPR
jgi:NodT family efflux transporter outer membrane factor (OMF) lipoprotein